LLFLDFLCALVCKPVVGNSFALSSGEVEQAKALLKTHEAQFNQVVPRVYLSPMDEYRG
jgi:hypothetical protein